MPRPGEAVTGKEPREYGNCTDAGWYARSPRPRNDRRRARLHSGGFDQPTLLDSLHRTVKSRPLPRSGLVQRKLVDKLDQPVPVAVGVMRHSTRSESLRGQQAQQEIAVEKQKRVGFTRERFAPRARKAKT